MEYILQIIGWVISLIPFVYGLFKENNNTENQKIINNIIIQQINPNYSFSINNNIFDAVQDPYIDIEKENKKWIASTSISLICIFLFIIIGYGLFKLPDLKGNILYNLNYVITIKPAIFLYPFLIIFYGIVLLIGYEKNKSISINIKNMSFFFFEFIAKIFMLLIMLIIEYIFSSNNSVNIFSVYIFICTFINSCISLFIFYISLTKLFSIEKKPILLKEKASYFFIMTFNYLTPLIIIILLINSVK